MAAKDTAKKSAKMAKRTKTILVKKHDGKIVKPVRLYGKKTSVYAQYEDGDMVIVDGDFVKYKNVPSTTQ